MFHKFSKGKAIAIGGDGDGWTIDSPFYWYRHTDNWKITGLNNSNSPESYNRRIYIRVKLNAGTNYQIGTSGDFDGKIWLYDINGSEITSADDSSYEVNGEYFSDIIDYTPSTSGVYIIGAGAYSDGQGDIRVCCYPAPETEEIPNSTMVYETSSGFNALGLPIKYRSSSGAGVNYSTIPTDNLILYMALKENRTSPEFVDSDVFSTNYEGNYDSANYQVVDNVPCLYLEKNTNIGLITKGNRNIRQATLSYWGKFTDSICCLTSSNGSYGGGSPEVWLYFMPDTVGFNNGSPSEALIIIPKSVSNDWHNITATWDMDTNYMYLYLDGELVGECTDGSRLAPNFNVADYRFYINNLYRASGNGTGNSYYSSVRMYDRVLKASEIKALAKRN